MNIGIIGGGVVGQATARTYLEHCESVRVYDVLPERRTHDLHPVLQCDLVFVCLPTPQQEGSLACDLSAVEHFFDDGLNRGHNFMDSEARRRNFVLRSTVPIGTTRRLSEQYGLPNLCHSPEFLTARCAHTDAQVPARNVIGTPFPLVAGGPGSNSYLWTLQELYERRFPGVPCHVMSSDESEAVKLFANGFFATKVAYWNEVRCLADRLGLDWERVMAAVLADGRIAHSHTKVPGPDGKFGFGGTCLPKDLASLVQCCNESVVLSWLTRAALERNLLDRERGAE